MHTKTIPLSADPMDIPIEKKEKIGMFGRFKNFVKEKVSKIFLKKSSDKADDSTKTTIDHSPSTTSDITSKKFSGLQNFAHSKDFSSKATNTADINNLKLKMFEMAKSALPAEILALPAEEQQKFIDILYKNMYGSLAGAMELRSNSVKDILKLIWKNKKQIGLLICIGLVSGFIGASLAPVLLGALGGASVLGGAVFTGAFAGMSRIFITKAFTKDKAKNGQSMIDMNTIEEKVKKEFFNTENLKMIVDNSVKQYKISKLPPEIMSIQNEIELANAIRNYLQTSDGARFSTLSEAQKTKEIAMYSALVKVYGNSLNMSVSAKNSSKSEFLKAGFLGGMAGAVGSSALLSSRVGVVAVTSAIGGLIHSYQTVDKKQKQKIMKQIQDFDPSIMTENEASLLQHLLNPHIKDTDKDIKKMHNLIMSNSALLNTLQNKLMQYYEIKKFNSIKADVCKKALKNIQLTSGEKIAHYLKTTATTVGVSTASAYILGNITDGVKEFLSPSGAEAAECSTGDLGNNPNNTPPTPPTGPYTSNTVDVPNTRGYYGNLLDSFNIIYGIGKSIYTFGTEGFGSAIGVLTKTIEDQMNISNIAAKAIAVALFAYGMRSSDAHKWYARAGFGFLSMITLGGSTLISNIAKRI